MARRLPHSPIALAFALAAAAAAAPSCSRAAQAAGPAETALIDPADPLAQVRVGESWQALGAHNSRYQGARDWEGNAEGYQTLWHENGVKKGEGRYEHSKKQGPWTWWYESGQKRWEGSYVDDEPAGLERSWYENGQLEYEGSFQSNEREGAYTRWYDSGQVEMRGEFKKGRRQGRVEYFNYDGSLDTERSGVYASDAKVAELAPAQDG